jgi:hypothetical protein
MRSAENEVIGIDIDTLLVLQMLSCRMIGIEYLHRMLKTLKNDIQRKARFKIQV